MFEKEPEYDYSHYDALIDYFISVLPYFQEDVFSLTLPPVSGGNYKNKGLKISMQKVRELFLKIYGFGRVHNDKEAEEKIREALKTLPMPEAYYPFAEFIHEYKRKAITKSVNT